MTFVAIGLAIALVIFIYLYYQQVNKNLKTIVDSADVKLYSLRRFRNNAGQYTPEHFTIPDRTDLVNLLNIIFEEAFELINAYGLIVKKVRNENQFKVIDILNEGDTIPELDLVEIVDAIVDFEYTMLQLYLIHGIHSSELFYEVHRANMSKFRPGGYRDENGKWIKPDDWQPPNIEAILEKLIPNPSEL
jgi:predicted HAD superfamily Cof-like phosphohydrolase